MIEALSVLFAIVSGLASWYYAHRAHKSSVQAPILKMAFCHPDTKRAVPTPHDPRTVIELCVQAADFKGMKEHAPPGALVGFSLPFMIRNVGTRTAKEIRVHARYGAGLSVSTNGKRIMDGDRPNWMVIENELDDLHPKQTLTYEGDLLVPCDELVHGVDVTTPVTSLDKKSATVTVHAELGALVEVVVFAQDLEPIVRRARVVFEAGKDKTA